MSNLQGLVVSSFQSKHLAISLDSAFCMENNVLKRKTIEEKNKTLAKVMTFGAILMEISNGGLSEAQEHQCFFPPGGLGEAPQCCTGHIGKTNV